MMRQKVILCVCVCLPHACSMKSQEHHTCCLLMQFFLLLHISYVECIRVDVSEEKKVSIFVSVWRTSWQLIHFICVTFNLRSVEYVTVSSSTLLFTLAATSDLSLGERKITHHTGEQRVSQSLDWFIHLNGESFSRPATDATLHPWSYFFSFFVLLCFFSVPHSPL